MLKMPQSKTFFLKNISKTPRIEQILYKKGCSLEDPFLGFFCYGLHSKGLRTGYIYLLDSLEDVLKARLQRYQSSDKSVSALRDIKALDLELSILLVVVIPGQGYEIELIIDEKYNNAKEKTDKQRNVTTGLFTFMIFVLAIGIWIDVLRKLKACYNNFKNVLRILPVSLVLSTFGLKSFLIRTSNGALDFIKNQIN